MKPNAPTPPKSPKLRELRAEYVRVKDDYAAPDRSAIIEAYHAELKACGRLYYHSGVERYARVNGSLFGEETMIEMGKIIGEDEP